MLDLSRVLAGPYCTMLLADLGADVVKVEQPGEGDETRTWGPPYDGCESTYFLSVNRGKRSVALDLKDPAAQEAARALARRADVVIENFRPGVADRLGLGPEALTAERPGLVWCSITGFGSGREPAGRPGYDFVLQAETGLMSITGDADGPRRSARRSSTSCAGSTPPTASSPRSCVASARARASGSRSRCSTAAWRRS